MEHKSPSKQKENLTKLSLQELEELYERQSNILKNKKLLDSLPDKGGQLQSKLRQVKKEIQHREDVKNIESSMTKLNINNIQVEALTENHVQHLCSMEKVPNKERYKPSTCGKQENKNKVEKPTQLISLAESITLLIDQTFKLPAEQAKTKVDGSDVVYEEDKEVEQIE